MVGERQAVRVRVWPATVIVAVQLCATFTLMQFGTTNVQSFIAIGGVPIIATILLLTWWLAFSRAPWPDKLLGLGIAALGQLCVVFSQRANGSMLLVFSIPVMAVGVVATLALTPWLRWPARRWVSAGIMIACAAVFTCTRVDSVGGNLVPILSWRWEPTAEERSTQVPHGAKQGTAALLAQPDAADWPGFRGANRDGRRAGVTFSTDWAQPPRELWRRPIGLGWSSFAAVGDYVFTQDQRRASELVTCYRADTGDEVWANQAEARHEDAMGSGPRATPTYDDGRLFAFGATGILRCLDASTGATVWTRDIKEDTGAGVPAWGHSCSPLVAAGSVFVYAGGSDGKSLVAYDRTSGAIKWTAGRGVSGYSSPELARLDGADQVLMNSDFGIQSFAPDTGALLWEHEWRVKTNPRVVQPLVVENWIVLGTTGMMGTRKLAVRKQEAGWAVEQVWETNSFRPYFNDFVYHDNHCYGFDGDRVACIDSATGNRLWEGRRCGGQLLLVADIAMLLVLTEKGDVMLVPATPGQYTEKARFKALTGKTWNHPVVARGRLFVRNANEMAAYALE